MADVLPPSTAAFEITARELSLPLEQVVAVAELLDAGNTPAFITRFRRDVTGGLAEARILEIKRRVAMQRSLHERKGIILKSIESQGALTSDLSAAIHAAQSAKQLEDLYLPFKPKKQSLGQVARQRGLDPLASDIFAGLAPETDLATQATHYVRVDRGLHTVDEVFKGVGHLISERFADNVELRKKLRDLIWQTGQIVTKAITAADGAAGPHESSEPQMPPTSADVTDAGEAAGSADGETAADAVAPSADAGAPSQPGATDSEQPTALPSSETEPRSEVPQALPLVPVEADAAEVPPTAITEAAAPVSSAPATFQPEPRHKKKKKKKTVKENDPFKHYADFSESVKRLPSHRVLAINRGERSKRLRVKVKIDEATNQAILQTMFAADHPFAEFLGKCASDSLNRLILPSLEREVRRELTENAEQHALRVFGKNLRHLLLKPPVRSRRVLAIDPGFRYGCHAAALDEFGNPLGHAVFHLVGNERRRSQGRRVLIDMIARHGCRMIAIGNGSACREAEQLVSDIINQELAGHNIEYVIVNEAGTNAYATSELGREELPHYDPAVRSAISIGRRLLDPLSELVKVDPAHLGIGLYQHDIKAKHLASELDDVVASCVNYVGVDVNRASPALLAFVSGVGKLTARRVFEYRLEHGPFKNRQEFKQVAGFGEQTFTQAAGFLRIVDGDNPLDSTTIHPESYQLAEAILGKVGVKPADLVPPKKQIEVPPIIANIPSPPVAGEGPGREPSAPSGMLANAPVEASHSAADAPQTTVAGGAADAELAAASSPVLSADLQPAVVESADAEPAANEPAAKEPDTAATPHPAGAAPAPAPVPPPAPRVVEVIDSHLWNQQRKQLRESLQALDQTQLANELGANPLVIADLIQALSQIGVDPRDRLPSVVARRSILKIDDIEPTMHFRGQVVNVVDFGVFVDIGLGDSSLIHISRLSEGFVSDPHLMFAVGDSIDVWVAQVEKERRRVTLTAIRPGKQRGTGRPPRRQDREQTAMPRSAGARPTGARPTGARPAGQRPPGPPRGGGRPGAGPRRGRAEGSTHTLPPKKIRKPPKPAPPITQEMIEGKAPMRSFSDLAQFFNKRSSGDEDVKS